MVARTFIARYKGEIIGRHASTTPFTHALIVCQDEEPYRRDAYEIEPDENERKEFAEITRRANAQIGDVKYPHALGGRGRANWISTLRLDKGDIEEAKKKIEGGFDPWFARMRGARIKDHE